LVFNTTSCTWVVGMFSKALLCYCLQFEIDTVYLLSYTEKVGRYGAVGIETRYGLNGPGIESCWGRVIPHLSRPALVPT
jgi:hypothetical protein